MKMVFLSPVSQPEDHNLVARLCQCFQLLGDSLVEEPPIISIYRELGIAFMHCNCAILQCQRGQRDASCKIQSCSVLSYLGTQSKAAIFLPPLFSPYDLEPESPVDRLLTDRTPGFPLQDLLPDDRRRNNMPPVVCIVRLCLGCSLGLWLCPRLLLGRRVFLASDSIFLRLGLALRLRSLLGGHDCWNLCDKRASQAEAFDLVMRRCERPVQSSQGCRKLDHMHRLVN